MQEARGKRQKSDILLSSPLPLSPSPPLFFPPAPLSSKTIMKEINQVAAALERQDYPEVARLLKQLQPQSAQNPWIRFYMGRYFEETQQLEKAEKIYRKLLQESTISKISSQVRQGIKRLELSAENRLNQAIAQAKADPKNREPGLLIVEAVSQEFKQNAAQQLARILKVDTYTARLQLQSHGWRLFRTGEIGQLQVYGQEMVKAGIPAFWATVQALQKIQVFRVHYFQSLGAQSSIICQNAQDQVGSLSFNWSEVSQRVEGLLPIFTEVMDYDPRRKNQQFRHKKMTQDYVRVCDLHLPKRHCILRFCDQSYQFQSGISFNPAPSSQLSNSQSSKSLVQNTTSINWNYLITQFNQYQPQAQVWSEFTQFAETAFNYPKLLSRIKAYLDIPRKDQEVLWDPAFQLYSTLAFVKPN